VFSHPTNPGEVGQGPVLQGLKQAGFVEGENMSIERRWAEGHYDRLPAMAADLVSRKVDLILTVGGTPPALAAKSATSTIPTVFTGLGNPVGTGLVASHEASCRVAHAWFCALASSRPPPSGLQNVKLTGQWSLRWIK
jgi:hypothetical protein